MTRKTISAGAIVFAISLFVMAATTPGLSKPGFAKPDEPRPNFGGSWVMDRERSFGLPGNMTQTMSVTQSAEQIEVETKIIQPNNERTVKDSYVLDDKEHEFTPPAPPNAPPNAPPVKGKRTTNWLPGGKALLVSETTVAESPKGPVTTQVMKKWMFSGENELTITLFVDSPNGSYEAKRVFRKK